MDELELWNAAQEGDGRAFARLFDTHQHRVLRHAAHLVSNPTLAEDIAATAFLELWRRRRDVRIVNGSVLPWLLVTTTNVARNSERALRRYEKALRSMPRDPNYSADVVDLLDDPLSPQQARLLRTAMETLSGPDSALLTLTALEGFSVADAARALGMRPDTARVRLHRAKTKARQIIQNPYPEVSQ